MVEEYWLEVRCSGFVVDGSSVDVMFPGTDTSSSLNFRGGVVGER